MKRKYALVIMTLAIVGSLMAGCSSKEVVEDSEVISETTVNDEDTKVESKADIQNLTVDGVKCGMNGSELLITVPSNPSTGYSWVITDLSAGMTYNDYDFIEDYPDEQLEGAGGTEIMHFNAEEPGDGAIKMVYRQDWDGGDTEYVYEIKYTVDDALNITINSIKDVK